MTSPARYTRTAMILHWLVAILIMANVGLVWTVNSMPDDWAWVRPFVDTHKSIGITVLGLAILRLLWRFTHPAPALPQTYPTWEKRAAHLGHIALYVLIFAMPITGWIHDSAWNGGASHPMSLFYTIPWFRLGFIANLDPATKDMLHSFFGKIHTVYLAYCLYALFVLHVLGALKHQILDKEPELERMVPWGREPE
jgi:cytochrome b561